MAASTSLQKRLERCAASVGYKGEIKKVPKEALSNRNVSRFLQWVVEQLIASNSLSQPELER